MPKISILIFILELHSKLGLTISPLVSFTNTNINLIDSLILNDNIIINNDLTIILKNLLLLSSLFSLLIGTIVGLSQTKIKRLLAYSTISHIGFILLALSINSQQAIESVLFYIIQYSVTNLNLFLILITIGIFIYGRPTDNLVSFNYKGSENDINLISQLKGIFFINPLISFCLTICFFSMAGIPPLLGFFAKQFVLSSALQNGYYFMSLLGIIVSIISACYYLKIIKILHTENNNSNLVKSLDYNNNNNHS
jgi:NADH-ubiquinone oxidoreductase chain 2